MSGERETEEDDSGEPPLFSCFLTHYRPIVFQRNADVFSVPPGVGSPAKLGCVKEILIIGIPGQ